jgi:hypothetical protein
MYWQCNVLAVQCIGSAMYWQNMDWQNVDWQGIDWQNMD